MPRRTRSRTLPLVTHDPTEYGHARLLCLSGYNIDPRACNYVGDNWWDTYAVVRPVCRGIASHQQIRVLDRGTKPRLLINEWRVSSRP